MPDALPDYAIHVCAVCRTQCDPDGHWGCPAKYYTRGAEHGPLVRIDVPAEIVTKALEDRND